MSLECRVRGAGETLITNELLAIAAAIREEKNVGEKTILFEKICWSSDFKVAGAF